MDESNNRLIVYLLGIALILTIAGEFLAMWKHLVLDTRLEEIPAVIVTMLATAYSSRKQGAEVTGQGSTVNVTQPVKEEVKP